MTQEDKIDQHQPFPVSSVETNDDTNENYCISSSNISSCPLEHIHGVSHSQWGPGRVSVVHVRVPGLERPSAVRGEGGERCLP